MAVNRRQFLQTGLATLAGLALPLSWGKPARAATPAVREYHLVAQPAKVSLGPGPEFTAWTYNGQVPGPEIRVRQGETIRVLLENRLEEPTTIHWHGVPLPNPMDGVPGVTQDPVPPGGRFVYEFVASHPGTFIYHSHVGYQLDQGLYGSLIVEPAQPESGHDREYSLLLEDWATVDGGGPAAPRRRPPSGMGMGGMGMGGMGGMGMGGMMGRRGGGGGPLWEPYYNAYAVNGRAGAAVTPLRVRRGQRVLLRLANVSSATIYHLRLAGHALTIRACDANSVRPMETDVLRIGMGERYDVEFLADNPGRWWLAAWDSGLGESGLRVPVVYEEVADGPLQEPDFQRGFRMANYWDLRAALPHEPPDNAQGVVFDQVLSGGMMGSPYWTINGEVYPQSAQLPVRRGQVVRLSYFNRSMMPHPMHLHGHFFRVVNPGLARALWPAKDTIIVDAMRRVEVEFLADNPGNWFHHCHNLYHMVAGMANLVAYLPDA